MSEKNWPNALGLKNVGRVYHNLSYGELHAHEIANSEGVVTNLGAVNIDTGKFTGRSPKDKYFVNQAPSNQNIAWGEINKPIQPEIFEELFEKVLNHLEGKDIYVFDGFVGASKKSKKNVRVVSEIAWQAHFVTNMFIRAKEGELEGFEPEFTVYNACQFTNMDWEKHGLNSEVFVIFNIEKHIAIIGGTWYGGEMKKGLFTMMNYWLPLNKVLSMHCSANIGKEGDTALFFGLSGTGKTTLSTDPHRLLIGDDEHGWDEDGIFNFEGGCYAKTINLDPKSEPEIHAAIKQDALLENVMVNEGQIDFSDASKTENTRVSYPIHHIENHEPTLTGGHPKNIIFLSYDAFGVLPPVAKLSKEQAMYYFLSGYTAKVAGTERGIKTPTATFSSCFGEAFLPLHPTVYAKLLGEKIESHEVNVYLVNTGITGGKYGVGKRMSIKSTRACINAILDGSINRSTFDTMPIFGIEIPKEIAGVPSDILNPRNAWENKEDYDKEAAHLASLFVKNFKKYITEDHEYDFSAAGPKI
jgi:phosphoenolpyruvate carboxykinase (ATP)